MEFGQSRRMIEAVKTRRDINLQHVLGAEFEAVQDRRDGIPTGTSWAKARGVRRQCGFPVGFQGLAYQRLPCPFVLGGNA